MEYAVQRLEESDLNDLRKLNNLFGDVFEDSASYIDNKPTDEYLKSFLRNKDRIVLVALDGDKVIGGLVAYTLVKFEMERKEIYIYDIAVSRDYQRKGLAKALIDKLKALARDLDAYVIFVQADEDDEAIKFYESLQPSENIRTRNFDYIP